MPRRARVEAARLPLAAASWKEAVVGVVPVIVAVLVYAGAFGNGFIWDDPLVLEQLRSMHGIGDVLFPPLAVPRFYYRPLIFATLLLDRAIGGEAPLWFHVSVVFWHAVVTALVFALARVLLGRKHALEAAAAALLFAVHPVHVESVAWIAGRSDVIATALVLLALLVAARWRGYAAELAVTGAFFLALAAKEVAVAVLVLVPAFDWCRRRRPAWTCYALLVAATLVYLALRARFVPGGLGGLPTGASPATVVRDLLAAVGWYASTLLWPVGSSAYVPHLPASPAYVIGGVVVVLAVGTGVVVAWRRGARVPAFLCLWFAVTLVPSLTVVVRLSASAPVADRYLYLPSVGAVILVAWGLSCLRGAAWRVAAVGVLLVSVLASVQSVARTRVWGDDLTFWRDVADKAPRDALALREMGAALTRRDRLDEAATWLRRALEVSASREDQVMTCNNLGNLYFRQGRLDEAEELFRRGLQLHRHAYLLNGLGRVAMRRAEQAQRRGDQREVLRQVRLAREALEEAVRLDARDYRSHALLGQIFFSLGRRGTAREHLEAAVRLAPRSGVADVARGYLRRLGG